MNTPCYYIYPVKSLFDESVFLLSLPEESIVIIFVKFEFKNRYYSSQFNLAILKVKMLNHFYVYLRPTFLKLKRNRSLQLIEH